MQKEERKVLSILDTLNAYCFFVGCSYLNISTRKEAGFWIIDVEADFNEEHKESVESLENRINRIKCEHTEEMYWFSIGSEEFNDDNDIDVIAAMIDEARVIIEKNTFKATFKRKVNE